MQSGSSISPPYYQPDPLKYALKAAKMFDPNFNTSSDDLSKRLKSLFQQQSASALLKASEEVRTDLKFSILSFQNDVDISRKSLKGFDFFLSYASYLKFGRLGSP